MKLVMLRPAYLATDIGSLRSGPVTDAVAELGPLVASRALSDVELLARLEAVPTRPAGIKLDCAAVTLCWGSTTEAWVKAEASKLDQWRRQARREQLEATLLAAPPSHQIKERLLRLRLPGVDRVVNMTTVAMPSEVASGDR